MILDNFIVFEGIDGAGTTTQLRLLREKLEQAGASNRVLFTAEPTDGVTGKFLRRILGGTERVVSGTTAYLFAADRYEHLYGSGGVQSALAGGKAVVSDRYLFSSLAYQSADCGVKLPSLLNSVFPLPQFLFFFDIEAAAALERVAQRGAAREIYEKREFLEKTVCEYRRVIGGYETLMDTSVAPAATMRIIRLDATNDAPTIAQKIWSVLSVLPIFKG